MSSQGNLKSIVGLVVLYRPNEHEFLQNLPTYSKFAQMFLFANSIPDQWLRDAVSGYPNIHLIEVGGNIGIAPCFNMLMEALHGSDAWVLCLDQDSSVRLDKVAELSLDDPGRIYFSLFSSDRSIHRPLAPWPIFSGMLLRANGMYEMSEDVPLDGFDYLFYRRYHDRNWSSGDLLGHHQIGVPGRIVRAASPRRIAHQMVMGCKAIRHSIRYAIITILSSSVRLAGAWLRSPSTVSKLRIEPLTRSLEPEERTRLMDQLHRIIGPWVGKMNAAEICLTISVVSHGHGEMVKKLLADLAKIDAVKFEVLLTVNTPEVTDFTSEKYGFDLRIIRNSSPKGFGANHNAAFGLSRGEYFVIINPDIRLKSLDLRRVVSHLNDDRVGVYAPLVINGDGGVEDSIRVFPTFGLLARRFLGIGRDVDAQFKNNSREKFVDWAAGMFLGFRRDRYIALQGFDERYFMYMEDVDICRRAHSLGLRVVYDPENVVIHDAQRASRRSLKHMLWHIRGALRFLFGPERASHRTVNADAS